MAAKSLRQDLECAVRSLQHELTAVEEQLRVPNGTKRFVTVSELYEDLRTIGDEFAAVDYDLQLRRLSVTTEPIVLDGTYLGPFEIQLQWARRADRGGPIYPVIAKDPHPAESRDNVTHPHVMDQILCEGDGRHAIQSAFSEGRLLDFFTLVAGVLRTYNSESPYVELALWTGASCADCGALVDQDDSYSCQKCDETICGECEVTCGGCDEVRCSGCCESCATCDERFCHGCLKRCESCRRYVCSNCLDENERCTNCHEEEGEREDLSGAESNPPVQPQVLGQAALPA
jgi:hypothetical protein